MRLIPKAIMVEGQLLAKKKFQTCRSIFAATNSLSIRSYRFLVGKKLETVSFLVSTTRHVRQMAIERQPSLENREPLVDKGFVSVWFERREFIFRPRP